MRLGLCGGTILALALAAPSQAPPTALTSRVEGPSTPDGHPARLTRGEWSQIRDSIRESEYHADRVVKPGRPPDLQARNRQQGYRTTFRTEGIEIVPQPPASWRLGVSVTGYGYEGDVRALPSAEPQARKERVEYHRGLLTEWYLNRPGGLEQGFELRQPQPPGAGPLVVALAIAGDLEVKATDDGARFAGRSGETRVRYAGLKAWDAAGRPLRSHVEAAGREIRLVVAASVARFPVTVDPLFVHEAQLSGHGDPFGQVGAQFGAGASVSGDTALVGAPTEDTTAGPDAGAAYVVARSGTTWAEPQRLLASNAHAGDFFGVAVSVSGDTAVVGAPYADTAGGEGAGSAYVFVRSGTTWSEQQRLTAADGSAGDNFGFTVSVSGDTVVVGAIFDDTPLTNAGSAYVFVRSGATWSQQQKLLASDAAPGDWLGCSVAISVDTVVAGAYGHDSPGGANTGSAYVFTRVGTTWSEQQKLSASDEAADDSFGYRVDVSGDTAVVAAPVDDTAGGTDAGSAYVFVRSGTTWTEQRKLLPSDGAALDFFGFWVAVSGDTAVVGAPLHDTAAGVDAGSAYVFARSGGTWPEQQKLLAPDGAAEDFFGLAVSASGETLVVGTPLDDTARGGDAGTAHVFVRSGTLWTDQQNLAARDGTAGEAFGYSLSVTGDTLVVGARDDDTVAGVDAGAAYVFVRAGTTWSEQQKLLASDGAPHDAFGASVSVSGDTVVVGAPGSPGGVGTGSAYVFVRAGTTWSEQQKLLASDGAAGDRLGYSVSASGDTAVAGAYLDDNPGGADAGSAYVFVRSGTAWTEQQKLLAPDGAPGDYFGDSVSASGDTVIVGAFLDDNPGGANAGAAYVFTRAGTAWTAEQKILAPDGAAGDSFGDSVSISGDTAAFGAHLADLPGAVAAGAAYVFVRSGTTWTVQQKVWASDGAENDQFGYSVFVSGDALAVGALLDDNPSGADAGSAYVFGRAGATWTEREKLLAPDGGAGDCFGYPVALSGDTVVVGAYRDDAPATDSGSAHVFRGSVPVELQAFTVE